MLTAAPATKWLPVAAVVITALLLVGPALADPTDRVAGVEGDPMAAVWQLHEMKEGHLGLVDPTTTASANAPSGAYLRRPIEVSTAAFDAVAFMLVKVADPVAIYNLLLVLAVLANGAAMLFLARRLQFGPIAATVSTLAFVAAPPLLMELQLHAALAFAFTIPLVAAFGVEMVERPRARAALAAGATTGIAMYVNPYVPLYTGVVLASLCIAVLVCHRRRGVGAVVLAIGTAFAIALPALVFVLANRSETIEATRRTLSEVALHSLGGGDYLRAFGDWWLVLPIVLCAMLGLIVLRSRSRAWWSFPAIAAVGFLLGLPPTASFGGVTIRLPSGVLFDLFPVWRVVGRASVLVWFVIALLVGAAVSRAESFADSTVVTVVFAVSALVACLAWGAGAQRRGEPWFPVNADPALADYLAQTPGRVAEYPLWGFDNAMGPYLLRQTTHGRALLNGGIPGTLSARLASVAGDAQDPQAATALAVAGVTRVAAAPGAPVPGGLDRVATTDRGSSVYDVPRRVDPVVVVVTGAYAREYEPDGASFRWVERRANLHVVSARPGRYAVRFVVWTPGSAWRQLWVAGKRAGELTPTPRELVACVSTRPSAHGVAVATLQVRSAEGPTRLSPSDPRRASLAIGGEVASAGCTGPGE